MSILLRDFLSKLIEDGSHECVRGHKKYRDSVEAALSLQPPK